MSWRREARPKRRAQPVAQAAKPSAWIARGSPEHAAWLAYVAERGATPLVEYFSALDGSIGFRRRSKWPPGVTPPAGDEGGEPMTPAELRPPTRRPRPRVLPAPERNTGKRGAIFRQ
ncbi:hypothetical protein [Methylosinus trichosporium]|uniref:hypothetical protein n=1 Tax=Methylosinus trichosporium TaxID=426 RepID=UPI00046318FB|nr:hypothetical protein [Methylosinus trichosporium]